MSLLKQSHRFLAPVTIVYFVLLHKTVGRVKSNFCVSYLLYLLWKRTDSLPPSPFSSLSIPHSASPPDDFHWICCESLCQSCIMCVLGLCWCVTAGHVSPRPSSVPVLRVLTGTHLTTTHTLKASVIPFDGTMCPLKSKPATDDPGL